MTHSRDDGSEDQVSALRASLRELQDVNVHLRNAQSRVRATFDSAAVGIAMADPQGIITLANRAFCEAIGYDELELAGKPFIEITHPDDAEQTRALFTDLLSGSRERYRYEKRFIRRDGGVIWMRVGVSALLEPDGRVRHVVAVLEDITTERVAAEAARERASLLRIAGRMARIGGWAIDLESGVVHWSDEIFQILEYPPGVQPDLEQSLALYIGDSQEVVRGAIDLAAREGKAFDVEVGIATYRGRHLVVRAVGEAERDASGVIHRVIGAFQDITSQKASERRLFDTGQRLTATLEAMNEAFVLLDPDWRFAYLNQEAEGLLRRDRDDLLGKSMWVEFPETVGSVVETTYRAAVQERKPRFLQTYFEPLDHWFEVWAHPSDEGLALYFRAIDDRKRAEERLAEQAALLDEARDAILVRDLEHRVMFWNKGAELMYGWPADQIVGRAVVPVAYEHPAQFDAAMQEVLVHGRWEGELVQRHRDGTLLTVFSRWALRRSAEGAPTSVLVIDTDVTARRRLEAQLLRSQRLESLGTLAGGIAHDLNNALAPILMSIEFLRLGVEPEEQQEVLSTIEASARRGADMVRQVLTFARGIEGQRVAINTAQLMRDVAKIVEETFLKEVRLELQLHAEPWRIIGDPTQLHQVVLNLALNARDAMTHGGTMWLSARSVIVDETFAAGILEAQPGPHVLIEVVDNGAGMSPDVLQKVYEPFFTTKPVGQGTGLGLPTVKAIVESHGGFLRIYSELGRGTKVQVYLPADPAAVTASDLITDEALAVGHGEQILVVDDEPGVRSVTQRTLERFGYRVVSAGGGQEALAIYAEQPGDFALVLTDMMMPQMDGPSLIASIRAIQPSARIVAASGLGTDGRMQQAAALGASHFLAKPYTARTLLETVRLALETG